jgi:hypothetical protein
MPEGVPRPQLWSAKAKRIPESRRRIGKEKNKSP